MRNTIMEITDDNSGKTKKTPLPQDVYSITHDLRAPLLSIKGLIGLLKLETEKERIDQYVAFLEASVDKMNDAISLIVESAKDSEPIEIPKEDIDFMKIIEESLNSLQYMEDM